MSENLPPQQNGSGARNDAWSVHDARPGAAHQHGDQPAGAPYPPPAPAPAGQQYPPPPVQQTAQPQQQSGVRSAATGHTYPRAVRPGGFAPSPAQYGSMAAGHAPPQNTTGELEQVWWSGQPESNRWVFNWVAYAAGGLMMLILIGIIMYNTGTSATLAGFLLALVPLTIVLAGVVWLDRWEPEPKSLLLVALLWGAGVSTLTSYWLNTAVVIRIFEATGDPEQATLIGAVVVAPVVEEITKGLGILLIFLLRREHFDGPVDGVVYAATVGAGFAFTENILYFAQSEDVVWLVFVMRGLASPFAHALFSACVGIALGLAARRSTAVAVGLAFPAGLVAAMGLHALWNGSASLGNTFLLLYFVVQVPLFIATIVLMVWLRRQESDVVRARLSEYAHAGWFAWHEVDMLASLRTRSQARQWAGTFGESAKQAMKAFQRDATQLAYLRQHVLTGRGMKRAHRSEHEILNQLQQDRHTFVSRAQR
ncbi:PrsW family intramembrane metalloprotease [Pseudactinotalea sp. Z1748]|uniref:PrsW family intramembrane metalloprotease n=1 Tax=Pseudactinotalea sp. Z1748 TaxID=3413027 RepID=UPI003C79CEC3